MTVQITYTQARAKLASLLEKVTDNREIVVIQQRGKEDIALIPTDLVTPAHPGAPHHIPGSQWADRFFAGAIPLLIGQSVLLATMLDNLRRQIIPAELRHQVNPADPGFHLLDQLQGDGDALHGRPVAGRP